MMIMIYIIAICMVGIITAMLIKNRHEAKMIQQKNKYRVLSDVESALLSNDRRKIRVLLATKRDLLPNHTIKLLEETDAELFIQEEDNDNRRVYEAL